MRRTLFVVLSLLLLTGCTVDEILNNPAFKGTVAFDLAVQLPPGVTSVAAVVRQGSATAAPTTAPLTINEARDRATGSVSVLVGKVYFSMEARDGSGALIMQSLLDSVTVSAGATVSVFPVMICVSTTCDGVNESASVSITAIVPTAEVEANGSVATATALPEFTTTAGKVSAGNGRIGNVADSDYFTFNVSADARVSVTVLAVRADATNPLDSEVVLYDPTGAAIASNDDCALPTSLDSCTPITEALAAGQYAIRVRSRLAASTGRYTVVITKSTSTSNLLFSDDFSAGLTNWVTSNDGGSWTISSGTLVGEYDISCGSPSCSQSDILLADARQPATANWRAEIQVTSVRYPYSAEYDLTYAYASFVLSASATEKLAVSAGRGVRNIPMPAELDSVEAGASIGMPWTAAAGSGVFGSVRWTPAGWNTVALEKRGNSYSVFFNGQKLLTTVKTFASSPKLGLHVYGKTVVDNFKLFSLP